MTTRAYTAGDIINAAAVELGLITDNLTDPYASPEPNIIRLRRIMSGVGQDLARDYDWSALVLLMTDTITANAGSQVLALPFDFKHIVGPLWNTTTGTELLPLTQEQYAAAVAGKYTPPSPGGYYAERTFIVQNGSAGTLLRYYASLNWLGQDVAAGTPDSMEPYYSTDEVWLDNRMLITGTKLAWARAVGMPSDGFKDDFERALSRAKGNDGAGQVLSLGRRQGLRLLDYCNLPRDGWGS